MWKKLKSTILFTHPRITLREDDVLLPQGAETKYLIIDESIKDSVTIFCFQDNKVLLQKEYAYPIDEFLYQLPGGGVEKDETIEDAVKRELQEECGLSPVTFEKIGWYYTNNRRSNHRMHVFLVTEVIETKKIGGDKEENITCQWLSISHLTEMIKKNVITNYSVLAAWALFCSR